MSAYGGGHVQYICSYVLYIRSLPTCLTKSALNHDYMQAPQQYDITSFENKHWHLLHINSRFGAGKIRMKTDKI